MIILGDSLKYLKGVGSKRLPLLEKLGIYTLYDLIHYYPRDYEDRRELKTIDSLVLGDVQSIHGVVTQILEQRLRRGLTLLKVIVKDETGQLTIPFFNQKFLKRQFKEGQSYLFSGKVEQKFGWQMTNASFERLEDNPKENRLNTGRIVPTYSLTEGLTQKALRKMIKHACDEFLDQLKEILPEEIIEKHHLMDRVFALQEIHFPKDDDHLEGARRRLIFEEFFFLQIILLDKRLSLQKEAGKAVLCPTEGPLVKDFWNQLSFSLTDAQQRVIDEISEDMNSSHVMTRLLQGDVGSGKTIVAVYAILLAIQNSYQVAFMAPTEILADQHFQILLQYIHIFDVKAHLLVGSTKKKERETILEELASGECQVLVGTHALIEGDVQFNKLGLVIIDEQHKFGVMQRARLQEKGSFPHILVMTATPIPRTLSMTVYGDLDVSIIDEMPQGRKPIKTFWIPEKKRDDLYRYVKKQVAEGRQVYWVYPLVEKSEKLDLKAVEEYYEQLKEEIFPDLRLGMIHGRMKPIEKELTMQDFKRWKLDVLVATTVIEVGIDVPNATVIVIEDSIRFGLAQLHQLRGRVGRGDHQSYCILMGEAKSPESKERLRVMCNTNDGFKIAEADLQIRGPGEFFGFRQSGLPELRIGSLISDIKLMELARKEAMELFAGPERLTSLKSLLNSVQKRFTYKMQVAGVA